MTMRVLWALCISVAALVTGIGFQNFVDGGSAVSSYPLVIAGILLLPAGSALIERLPLASSAD